MAAGVLQQAEGTDRLTDLRGAALRHPGTVLVLAVASVNLIGLPPSLGFIGKWWILRTSLHNGQWILSAVILGGAVLAGAYLFRVFEVLLRPADPAGTENRRPPVSIKGMLIPAMALALASLLPVLFLKAPEHLLSIDSPVGQTPSLQGEAP